MRFGLSEGGEIDFHFLQWVGLTRNVRKPNDTKNQTGMIANVAMTAGGLYLLSTQLTDIA